MVKALDSFKRLKHIKITFNTIKQICRKQISKKMFTLKWLSLVSFANEVSCNGIPP